MRFSLLLTIGPSLLSCSIFVIGDLLNVPKELVGEGVEGANNIRGVKARLAQKGVNYIATFLSNLMANEVANAKLGDKEMILETKNGVLLEQPEIEIHTPPKNVKTKTKQPRDVFVEISEMSFTINARLKKTGMPGLNTSVQLVGHSTSVLLEIVVELSPAGSPQYKIEKCEIRQDKLVAIVVRSENGVSPELKKSLEEIITSQSEKLLNNLICTRVVFVTDKQLNERLALLATKISLVSINDNNFIINDATRKLLQAKRQKRQSFKSSGDSAAKDELFGTFDVSRADDLFLDYSIVNIVGTDEGFEIDSVGEVSLKGRGGTPFGPMELTLPESANEEAMLQILVSDFLPNSLMYHGHTIGLFNAKVDHKNPHFGSVMRTSCQSANVLFCIGDFLPTLRKLHPEHNMVLSFATSQSPVLKFHPQSNGGITFALNGRIGLSILDNNFTSNETLVAEMSISVSAHMRIRISSAVVRPRMILDSIKLKTLTPGILLQDELDKSVMLAREVLQKMVNDVLRTGIPIPVHPTMRLSKPKVKVVERALLLQTNIEFNERLLRQLINVNLDKREAIIVS